jgi:hypothetical protein
MELAPLVLTSKQIVDGKNQRKNYLFLTHQFMELEDPRALGSEFSTSK